MYAHKPLICVLGPVHRFKKLCEKLQLILLSNQRRSTSNCRAEDEIKEEHCSPSEQDSPSRNSKLQLAQLSDTESEGELLDSPRASKKPISTHMNGKGAENHAWNINRGNQDRRSQGISATGSDLGNGQWSKITLNRTSRKILCLRHSDTCRWVQWNDTTSVT